MYKKKIVYIYINKPIVGERSSKESEVKQRRRLLLPTPESPIINNLNKYSNSGDELESIALIQ